MFGCATAAAATASRRNRVRSASSSASTGSRVFTATGRARSGSSPRHTVAMPPRAISASRRYRPPRTRPGATERTTGSTLPVGLTKFAAFAPRVGPRRATGASTQPDADGAGPGVGADHGTDLAELDLVARHDRRRRARGTRRCRAPARGTRRRSGGPWRRRASRRGGRGSCCACATLPDSATTPSRTSITGLIDSMLPSIACAPPIRPPRRRCSSVSSAPKRRVRRAICSARADDGGDVGARPRPSCAAAMHWLPRPIETHIESTTVTGSSPSSAFAADLRRLHGARQPRRQVDAHDAVGAGVAERPETLLEGAGRGRRGLGQHRRGRDLAPELLVRELDAVDELLVAEADRQRHDLDAERVGAGLREIAGAVGDDAYGHETSWASGSGSPRVRGPTVVAGRPAAAGNGYAPAPAVASSRRSMSRIIRIRGIPRSWSVADEDGRAGRRREREHGDGGPEARGADRAVDDDRDDARSGPVRPRPATAWRRSSHPRCRRGRGAG